MQQLAFHNPNHHFASVNVVDSHQKLHQVQSSSSILQTHTISKQQSVNSKTATSKVQKSGIKKTSTRNMTQNQTATVNSREASMKRGSKMGHPSPGLAMATQANPSLRSTNKVAILNNNDSVNNSQYGIQQHPSNERNMHQHTRHKSEAGPPQVPQAQHHRHGLQASSAITKQKAVLKQLQSHTKQDSASNQDLVHLQKQKRSMPGGQGKMISNSYSLVNIQQNNQQNLNHGNALSTAGLMSQMSG